MGLRINPDLYQTILQGIDLLKQNPHPTRAQIVEHMNTNICRCGSYPRIVRAIERAAKEA